MYLRPPPTPPQQPPSLTTHRHHLSSTTAITSSLALLPNFSALSITLPNRRPPSTVIRMGGGPRTFPGGVSKWQWKRMQAKKAKQLLKARLARERHIYEMRKRAELKAAVSELERPWEVIKKAAPMSSSLFSVAADEQLKVLADRFQKPEGFDMWSEKDGPQLFVTPDEGLPTARFFPKGVIHSIRPYGKIDHGVEDSSEERTGAMKGKYGHRKRIGAISRNDQKDVTRYGSSQMSISKPSSNGVNRSNRRDDDWSDGVLNVDGDRRSSDTDDDRGRKSMDSRQVTQGLEGGNRNFKMRRDGGNRYRKGRNLGRSRERNSQEVYDMSLQGDGNYGFSGNDELKTVEIRSRGYKQKMIKSYLSE